MQAISLPFSLVVSESCDAANGHTGDCENKETFIRLWTKWPYWHFIPSHYGKVRVRCKIIFTKIFVKLVVTIDHVLMLTRLSCVQWPHQSEQPIYKVCIACLGYVDVGGFILIRWWVQFVQIIVTPKTELPNCLLTCLLIVFQSCMCFIVIKSV